MGFDISRLGLTGNDSSHPIQIDFREIPSHIVEAMNHKAYIENLIHVYRNSTSFLPGEGVAKHLEPIHQSTCMMIEALERQERVIEGMKLQLSVEIKLRRDERVRLLEKNKVLTAQHSDVVEKNRCLEDADYASKEKVGAVSAENLHLHALLKKKDEELVGIRNKIISKKRKEKGDRRTQRMEAAFLEAVSASREAAAASGTENRADVDINQEAFNC